MFTILHCLAPLPFEEYGPLRDQTHVDDQLPADPITFPQYEPYFNEDSMMPDSLFTAAPYMEMSAALQCLRIEQLRKSLRQGQLYTKSRYAMSLDS
jgi:hypothetical protein